VAHYPASVVAGDIALISSVTGTLPMRNMMCSGAGDIL
jgi:hypothetical protein